MYESLNIIGIIDNKALSNLNIDIYLAMSNACESSKDIITIDQLIECIPKLMDSECISKTHEMINKYYLMVIFLLAKYSHLIHSTDGGSKPMMHYDIKHS